MEACVQRQRKKHGDARGSLEGETRSIRLVESSIFRNIETFRCNIHNTEAVYYAGLFFSEVAKRSFLFCFFSN